MRYDEVAVLKLSGKLLHFVFPPHLRGAGTIPITSSAVAAKTANNRASIISNEFVRVQHLSVFELIPNAEADNPGVTKAQVIQKLMSAAVVDEQGSVFGVIQISRKGETPTSAGPNFTGDDLKLLEAACGIVALAVCKLH